MRYRSFCDMSETMELLRTFLESKTFYASNRPWKLNKIPTDHIVHTNKCLINQSSMVLCFLCMVSNHLSNVAMLPQLWNSQFKTISGHSALWRVMFLAIQAFDRQEAYFLYKQHLISALRHFVSLWKLNCDNKTFCCIDHIEPFDMNKCNSNHSNLSHCINYHMFDQPRQHGIMLSLHDELLNPLSWMLPWGHNYELYNLKSYWSILHCGKFS